MNACIAIAFSELRKDNANGRINVESICKFMLA
jgi:hypothetical protein